MSLFPVDVHKTEVEIMESMAFSRKYDIIYWVFLRWNFMAVCYKKLQHLMIEKGISHAELMRRANLSANIITKIKTGQYIALYKVESICAAMGCTPSDILEFIPNESR